jgi:hypothetical protein
MSLGALRSTKPCRWCFFGKTPGLASLLVTLIVWLGAGPGPGPRPVLAAPLQDQQTISVPINKSRVLDLRDFGLREHHPRLGGQPRHCRHPGHQPQAALYQRQGARRPLI